MRSAMAMIELIFAMVIIAISIITIPTMMSVAGETSKRLIVDDDIMARLTSQLVDKFQARWGGEYVVDGNNTIETNISMLANIVDLNCSRVVGADYLRMNPDSSVNCNLLQIPLPIPIVVGNGANQADGNVSKGIEKLNGGTETLSITSSTGETFDINATYNVRYVPSALSGAITGNTARATWRLGSSGSIDSNNSGSAGINVGDRTHLKRVVVRFSNNEIGVDTTMTFFKSNIGINR